jgi:hypothetical protein
MAKKKIDVVEDGLKSAAVAVGTALGKLAHKVGLGETSPPPRAAKKASASKAPVFQKKAVAKKTAAAKKVATKKKTAPKKAAAKPSNAKKVTGPTKKK